MEAHTPCGPSNCKMNNIYISAVILFIQNFIYLFWFIYHTALAVTIISTITHNNRAWNLVKGVVHILAFNPHHPKKKYSCDSDETK